MRRGMRVKIDLNIVARPGILLVVRHVASMNNAMVITEACNRELVKYMQMRISLRGSSFGYKKRSAVCSW